VERKLTVLLLARAVPFGKALRVQLLQARATAASCWGSRVRTSIAIFIGLGMDHDSATADSFGQLATCRVDVRRVGVPLLLLSLLCLATLLLPAEEILLASLKFI